ncbi:MAG: hypothetical protein Q9195_004628 [Heterodermia aff. obscurata]
MAAPTHEKSEMQHDVDHWMNRVNHVAKDHSGITNPTGTAPWYSLNKDGDLIGYNVVNASCLGWWAVSCFGAHCIPNLLQRHEIRERSQPNLQGNFVTDFLKAWCCSCCDLIQQEKEAQHLLSIEKKDVTMQQPGKTVGMTYGPQ